MNNITHAVGIAVRYFFECFAHYHLDGSLCLEHGRCGKPHFKVLRWADGFQNLVVTLGRNALLDNTFNAAASSVNWYVGLKDTGTPNAADTMASHASWATITPYSNATNPAWTKNGAASGGAMSNSSSKAVFTINATDDVYGAFLCSDNTKGGTAGTLFGAGDFGSARSVQSGDSLNVQVDLSITAS